MAFLPEGYDAYPSTHIRQGYLEINEDGSERRIRDRDGVYTETRKTGKGLVRGEKEWELSLTEFAGLWPATEGKRVEKRRFTIPYGNFAIELDVYEGKLAGLMTAEVEFPDENTASSFIPPEWLSIDVTDDPAYKNQQLAIHGMPQ